MKIRIITDSHDLGKRGDIVELDDPARGPILVCQGVAEIIDYGVPAPAPTATARKTRKKKETADGDTARADS